MINVLKALVRITLNTSWDVYYVISAILVIVGLCRLFKKSGVSPKHALIPAYRQYMLARCAGVEGKGRNWFVLEILDILVGTIAIFLPANENLESIIALALVLPLWLIDFVYSIQIYMALIKMYRANKLWIIPWLMWPVIPALLWGFMKKYQPQYKLSEIEEQKETIISGNQAVVMDAGLTVNLEERTAQDFFQKKYLLRDIHMNITPGHMVLLLGGSGAGKTTLLNAITGYEKAKAEIVLNGVNIYSDYKKMQHQISFVPQMDLMRYKDTVYNTLMDAAALRLPFGFSPEDRKKRVQDVMEIFGLTPVQKSLVEKLSGGQKKRLSIAMEFIPNPSLFILDEPDSGLDGVMARELMVQLKKIASLGKIVIVITHTPDRVIDLFDDVIVLAKDSNRTGRLAYFGPITEAKEFFEKDSMEKIVKSINAKSEGGDDRADEFVNKFAEVQHG